MITIIAEKPSAGMDIARIVGARQRADGYMHGNGYAVTWAYGHLVEIYSEEGDDWNAALPVLPDSFKLRIGRSKNKSTGKREEDPGYRKQLSVIKDLFSKSEAIINAGDAGREGELIQRYIYQFVRSNVPVRRLWISSLTDEAIRTGLRELKDSIAYDNLYLAGKARNEADWLVGINCTRALMKAVGGNKVLSLGRVQTPLLGMICSRYLENKNFVPEKFWTLNVKANLAGTGFITKADGRYATYEAAYSDLQKVQTACKLDVLSVDRKAATQQPPLPYDLTALQREANKRYGMSAGDTLKMAQNLYDKKLATYPRTGSRYLTEDVFKTLPGLLKKVLPADLLALVESHPLNRRCMNDGKVTDHHALLPTGNTPQGLSEPEKRIYDLIVTRMAEALCPAAQVMNTTVKFDSDGVKFTCKGQTIIEAGWRSVRNEKQEGDNEDENQTLPPFRQGDICPVVNAGIKEALTKPKPLYTDDSLLEAMEHAGRGIEDATLKDAIKECGLGTPATRAAEIEIVILRGYVVREKKALIPTPLGLSVYDEVKDKSICNVEMTARWEQKLAMVSEGDLDAAEFDREIREYVSSITTELLNSDTVGDAVRQAELLPGAVCPKCGGPVILRGKSADCQNSGCGFRIWKEVAGKQLQQKDIVSLLNKGETMELKGFKSKSGKTFNAKLVLQDDKLNFQFVDHNVDAQGNRLVCPVCGKPVWVHPQVVNCSDEACGWKLWRTICEKTITEPILHDLLGSGKTKLIKGFTSKPKDGGKPKKFDAMLTMGKDGKISFQFPPSGGGMTLKKKN